MTRIALTAILFFLATVPNGWRGNGTGRWLGGAIRADRQARNAESIQQEAVSQEDRMKALLALTAVGEAVTGLALLVYPPIVVRLLFGAEIAGVGVVMSRVAGAALLAIGVACWLPRRRDKSNGILLARQNKRVEYDLGSKAIRHETVVKRCVTIRSSPLP
jgi:hypothetical protein